MSTRDNIDKAKQLRATMQIGKNGINQSVIEEVKKQLKKREMLKIKLLKSFDKLHDRKQVAAQMAEAANASIVHVVGFTIVLKRNK